MKTPRTPEGRVSRVANGDTINGTYCLPPGEALEAFRADLKELVERPTVDAYMASNRALHWRTAELRAHGIEPLDLTKVADLTHYPPEGYDFGVDDAERRRPSREEFSRMLRCINWRHAQLRAHGIEIIFIPLDSPPQGPPLDFDFHAAEAEQRAWMDRAK